MVEELNGLTEEYIESQIKLSSYSGEVRRSVRRFYEGLNEPAAPVVGLRRGEGDKAIDPFPSKQDVVAKLAEKGIEAVTNDDPRAADPNVFVVADNLELHAPFLSPKEALKANIAMIEVISEYGGRASCSNPHTRETLVEAKHVDQHEEFSDLYSLHPEKSQQALKDFYQEFSAESKESFHNFQKLLKSVNPETKQIIVKDFNECATALGGINTCTFEQRNELASNIMKLHEAEILADAGTFKVYQEYMRHEAWEKGISPEIVGKDNAEALAQGNPPIHVFHGGQQGTKPYANLGKYANIDFQFGAVGCQYECGSDGALGYALGQSTHSGKKYTQENSYKYGFLYQYESRKDKQEIFFVENAGEFTDGKFNAHEYKNSTDETVIMPHQNKLEKMYLVVEEVNPETKLLERRLFELETDEKGQIKDKRWRDFAELHDPINDNLKGYMVDRRNNLIRQYDEEGIEKIMSRKLDIKITVSEINSAQNTDETKSMSDKEKIAALSGRSGSNMSATAQQEQTTPVVTVMKETIKENTVNSTPSNSSVKAEQVTENAAKPKESFPQKIADMTKEKFGKFVGLLRKGYNAVSGEGINPQRSVEKANVTKQQTNTVQATAINIKQNIGNDGR